MIGPIAISIAHSPGISRNWLGKGTIAKVDVPLKAVGRLGRSA